MAIRGLAEPGTGRDVNGTAVQLGPGPLRGREGPALDRVVDHPDDELALVFQGDRDAPEREPVGVVDRPVERVDDPAPGVGGVGLAAVLFGQQGLAGEASLEDRPDQALAGRIGLGDEVARVFFPGDDVALHRHEERPGLASRPLGDDPVGSMAIIQEGASIGASDGSWPGSNLSGG